MKKLNNITGNWYSDEWFTDQQTVDLIVQLLNPKGIICCPFDSESSLFTKTAQSIGECIFGMDDWLESDYHYNYLMTNPPFSIKDLVIEKVAASGKPSALVLPLDSLGGVKRNKIYQKYGYPAVYVPTKRINYFDQNWNKREGSNFHSVILLFNTKREGLLWESKSLV